MPPHVQMTEAEKKAEEMRKKDAEILARRKKKFDAARFDHIEKTNKIHGQPKPQEPRPEPPRAAPEKEDAKKKKWSLFKKKPKAPAKTAAAAGADGSSAASQTITVKPPPPIAAGSVKPEFHSTQHEIAPNWASVDRKNERPQPSVGHSSDACYPRPPSAAAIPTHVPTNKRPDRPALPQYNTVGYGTAGRSTNKNNNNTGVASTIAAFQAGAAKPKTGDPRQMKQPKVSTSTSETMDPRGNITRTITRTITEPNGKVRTETQVVEIPAKR